MIVSTTTLARAAEVLNNTEDQSHYSDLAESLREVLRNEFWDSSRNMYDDWYIDDNGIKQFVGHTGYMNFFPLFLGGIDPSEDRFETVFNSLVAEETGIWTDFGIRSLSKNDPYYKMGDDYWTSPIWMNLNFLIVTALHTYSKD